jgi:hypothetical protein
MPWYTWAFSGVGAVVVIPLLGWLAKLLKSKPGNAAQVRPDDPGNGQGGDKLTAPEQPAAPSGATQAAPATATQAPPSAGLVDSLLAVPGMSDPAFRHTIYDHIPPIVVQQINMDKRARMELISLVDTFDQYPHLEPWQALLDRIRELLPAHPAVGRLEADLVQRGLIKGRLAN